MGDYDYNREMRFSERRKMADRRKRARFSDVLVRRLGVERRLPIYDIKPASNEVSH